MKLVTKHIKVLKIFTILCVLVAFCLMFGPQVKFEGVEYSFIKTFFTADDDYGVSSNILPFIGYVLILIAGIIFIYSCVKSKPRGEGEGLPKLCVGLDIFALVLLIIGLIFVAIMPSQVISIALSSRFENAKSLYSLTSYSIWAIVLVAIAMAVILLVIFLECGAACKEGDKLKEACDKYEAAYHNRGESIKNHSNICYILGGILIFVASMFFFAKNQLTYRGISSDLHTWNLISDIAGGYNYLPVVGYGLLLIVSIVAVIYGVRSFGKKGAGSSLAPLLVVVFTVMGIIFIALFPKIYGNYHGYESIRGFYGLGSSASLAIALAMIGLVIFIIPHLFKFLTQLLHVLRVAFMGCVHWVQNNLSLFKALVIVIALAAVCMVFAKQGAIIQTQTYSSAYSLYEPEAIQACIYASTGVFYFFVFIAVLIILSTLSKKGKERTSINKYIAFEILILIGILGGFIIAPEVTKFVLDITDDSGSNASWYIYSFEWSGATITALILAALDFIIAIPLAAADYFAKGKREGRATASGEYAVLPNEMNIIANAYEDEGYKIRETSMNESSVVLTKNLSRCHSSKVALVTLSIIFGVATVILFVLAYGVNGFDSIIYSFLKTLAVIVVILFGIFLVAAICLLAFANNKAEIVLKADESAPSLVKEVEVVKEVGTEITLPSSNNQTASKEKNNSKSSK